ncbi:MAG: glucose-1-phosphate adenylyltransferase subunit GlgD [Ruminococcaceae bacterium]|nr:glucose-1-phosphate adenylyltransferase subunit GlgD [Oscillospiraceae bacterium]
MINSAVAGIVFANVNDDLLKKLTSRRSMASVPFGARYRLIDFPLSNLVNAGAKSVGIVTKENYRSLMDHIGNGIYWDLDRRNGGLFLLPPYITSGARRYNGTIDALYGAMDYIKHCKSEYIVLCNADVLANVDISSAIETHIGNSADITLIYHKGNIPVNNGETMMLEMNDYNVVTGISLDGGKDEQVNYSIGYTIISRELLLSLVKEAHDNDVVSFNREVLANKVKQLKIIGFEHSGYVTFMNGTDSYYKTSMDLLDPEIRKQLFNRERPIYTKTRDDMPTRYGTKSQVKNSLIAAGCVIEGTVINSVLFRGVKVEKGAVVKNCILMQETKVGANAQLDNVIADKNAVIGEEMILKGTAKKRFFIKKNEVV